MNSREKFNSVMSFDSDAVVPKTEFAYWAGAIRKWFDQGLPAIKAIDENIQDSEAIRGSAPLDGKNTMLSDVNVSSYFGLDPYFEKFPFDISPMFKKEMLSLKMMNIWYIKIISVLQKKHIKKPPLSLLSWIIP